MLIIMIALTACSKSVSGGGKSEIELMSELCINKADAIEVEKDGSNMYMIYEVNGRKMSITVFSKGEKVICKDGEKEYVMYENGEIIRDFDVIKNYDRMKKGHYTKVVDYSKSKEKELGIADGEGLLYMPYTIGSAEITSVDGRSAKVTVTAFSQTFDEIEIYADIENGKIVKVETDYKEG